MHHAAGWPAGGRIAIAWVISRRTHQGLASRLHARATLAHRRLVNRLDFDIRQPAAAFGWLQVRWGHKPHTPSLCNPPATLLPLLAPLPPSLQAAATALPEIADPIQCTKIQATLQRNSSVHTCNAVTTAGASATIPSTTRGCTARECTSTNHKAQMHSPCSPQLRPTCSAVATACTSATITANMPAAAL
jgi:hypothetical protein